MFPNLQSKQTIVTVYIIMWMIIYTVVTLHTDKAKIWNEISLLLQSRMQLGPVTRRCAQVAQLMKPNDSKIREQDTVSTTVGRSQVTQKDWDTRRQQSPSAVPTFPRLRAQCGRMNRHLSRSFDTKDPGNEMFDGFKSGKRSRIHKDSPVTVHVIT